MLWIDSWAFIKKSLLSRTSNSYPSNYLCIISILWPCCVDRNPFLSQLPPLLPPAPLRQRRLSLTSTSSKKKKYPKPLALQLVESVLFFLKKEPKTLALHGASIRWTWDWPQSFAKQTLGLGACSQRKPRNRFGWIVIVLFKKRVPIVGVQLVLMCRQPEQSRVL